MKGAPEMVILRCSRYLKNGEILPITDEFKSKYLENYRNYGK
jgi:sodium/potassium-transporting ATPase subunit alpha